MELPVRVQLSELGWALAVGAALGLLYDLMRPLRRGRISTAAADLLYSLLLLLTLLAFGLYAGRGRLRVYALSFMTAAFVLYWLTLGRAVRAFFRKLDRGLTKLSGAVKRAALGAFRAVGRGYRWCNQHHQHGEEAYQLLPRCSFKRVDRSFISPARIL